MQDLFDIAGRCILVTGASSGIGRNAARLFASRGAKVAIVARRAERLEALAAEIGSAGGSAFALPLDVTDAPALESAIDRIERDFAPIDVLVNNAGSTVARPVLEQSLEDFTRVVDLNLTAAYWAAHVVARRMVARKDSLPRGGGSIINITSVAAVRVRLHTPGYVSSKAGLANLTRALAWELAPHRIRVNSIAPGLFDSELAPGFADSPEGKRSRARIPMGRVGRENELEGALLLLASDASSYMSGSEILVDGASAAGRTA